MKLFEKGQDFADGVVDKGLEQAIEFLGNEDNQYGLIEKRKDIVVNVLCQVAKTAVEASKNEEIVFSRYSYQDFEGIWLIGWKYKISFKRKAAWRLNCIMRV